MNNNGNDASDRYDGSSDNVNRNLRSQKPIAVSTNSAELRKNFSWCLEGGSYSEFNCNDGDLC